jgi:DNA-binding PadR family transcriptional regulator
MTGIDTPALDRELKKGSAEGWIKGAWVEKPGERRRRFYKVTAHGRRVMAAQLETWEAFVEAVRRIAGAQHA